MQKLTETVIIKSVTDGRTEPNRQLLNSGNVHFIAVMLRGCYYEQERIDTGKNRIFQTGYGSLEDKSVKNIFILVSFSPECTRVA
jgi:hypothetical protein